MISESIAGTTIAIFTGLVTYLGFKHFEYQNKYKFEVDGILIRKEYYRLITSGFLHVNWLHYAFNMVALVSFSSSLEVSFGTESFLLIYFLSILGGSLFSLNIHKNHGDYSAVGASGGVSGIVAAFIILYPNSEISFIFLPIGITSWIFGIAYILISIIGIKSQADNIGHEAHLGGVLVGILSTIVLGPAKAYANWWVVVLLLGPIIIFNYLIYKRPDILITKKWNIQAPQFNRKRKPETSVDDVLDKIRSKGMDSLTKKEREILDAHSNKNSD